MITYFILIFSYYNIIHYSLNINVNVCGSTSICALPCVCNIKIYVLCTEIFPNNYKNIDNDLVDFLVRNLQLLLQSPVIDRQLIQPLCF